MPDLNSELQQMADHAAHTTRPPAAADIIARGRRRRVRTAAQKSLAVLSAAGVTAAVIATGAASSSSPPAPAAAGTAASGNTLTETTSSAAGTMTVTVRYRYGVGNKIRLVSVTCTGHSAVAFSRPALIAGLSAASVPGGQSPVLAPYIYSFTMRFRQGSDGDFTGSLPARDLAIISRADPRDGEMLSVSLSSRVTIAGKRRVAYLQSMVDAMILTSRPA